MEGQSQAPNVVSRAEGLPPRQPQLIPEVHPGLKKEVEGGGGGREVGVCPGSQALGEGAENSRSVIHKARVCVTAAHRQTDRQYVRDSEVLF